LGGDRPAGLASSSPARYASAWSGN